MKNQIFWPSIFKGWLVIVAVWTLIVVAVPVESSDENGDAYWLAMNMYFEAGNQSEAGRIAVALVTINRKESWDYPDDIETVVTLGHKFEILNFYVYRVF
jgi:hypothetical protein